MSSTQQLLLGEGAGGGPANYIEDVFSTYLYNGTSTTNPINNGIDLSGKGGLVWGKRRNAANSHFLIDTVRGAGNRLESDGTGAQTDSSAQFPSFNSNGFTVATADNEYNNSAGTFCSWTFRKQPKFFDVVTYTGDGISGKTVAHNLGVVPGCIIVKRTNTSGTNWRVYHRELTALASLQLNVTNASAIGSTIWNDTEPTSTNFTVGDNGGVNSSGDSFVAYLFAHDAGGFGLTGTDNVISCGSVSATGGTLAEVNLGWEPQWLLIKGSSITNGWSIIDNMRGFTANKGVSWLQPNTSAAEVASPTTPSLYLTSTGFKVESNESPLNGTGTYIYIAIRRGPMKVPTSGTSVLDVETWSGNSSGNRNISVGFPADLNFFHVRNAVNGWNATDRLRGNGQTLQFNSTGAESNVSPDFPLFNSFQNELQVTGTGAGYINETGYDQVFFNLRRAPSFFDEVCYTGTGTAGQTYTHNLGVVPELMIVKGRSIAEEWNVYFGNNTNYLKLNRDDVPQTATTRWNDTSPTSSVFSVGTSNWVNASGSTYVAYLFASLAGVSKVGSYTGNGTTQTINCGFTGGARFVLIKRTDALGGWYTYDTARGMTVLTDPYLLMNSTAAEVATLGSVTTVSTGFAVNNAILAGINAASPAAYIFLAIA